MVAFRFENVHVEAAAFTLPPIEVTSAEIEDRLAPLYERLQIPFGTLEKLSGIKSRYLWPREMKPSLAATEAAKRTLEESGIDRSHVRALFNCSVTRDYFEPSTASLVHGNLGLGEDAITMDISNACIGLSNGLLTLASLIESGTLKAGLVVSAENVGAILESSFAYLLKSDSIDRERLFQLMPTFTLGSGAAAILLCHASIAAKPHRLLGAVSFSATQYNDLCVGNADYCAHQEALDPIMETDSQKIIASAAKVGSRVWPETSALLGWSAEEVDHLFCHQVGKQVNGSFFKEMGLDNRNEFVVYPRFGNQVSVALPAAFITGIEEREIKAGEKILLTAFGSGLNAIFSGIIW